MYRYLLEAAKVQRTFNIKYVATGLSVTTSDGKTTFVWNEIKGGAAYPVDGDTILKSKVVDIFIPSDYEASVQMNGGLTETFPRYLILAHELLGHGRCGEGMCAVTIENELRGALKLKGKRTGKDHDGGDSFTTDVEVSSSETSTETINAVPGIVQTTIQPRPMISLPSQPQQPKKP